MPCVNGVQHLDGGLGSLRFTDELETGVAIETVALARVDLLVAGHEVLPRVAPTAVAREDMIEVELSLREFAPGVLTRVAIALKNSLTSQARTLLGDFGVVGADDD